MFRRKRTGSSEKGAALVEFLITGVFWLPLLFGTMIVGINIIRAIQVTQVCRDAGHMFSQGIDFSQSANQSLIVNLANGLSFSTSGGNGDLILSTVTFVGPTDCVAGGLQANTSSCPNMNQHVFTSRLVVGNSSIHASMFGTPNSTDVGSSGSIASSYYLTDTSTRAIGFSSLITLTSGQSAYMSEMFVNSADYSWWSLLGTTGSSARSIF